MSDSAVYFPHINLPTCPWMGRALLYWDEIVTIAPEAVRRSGRGSQWSDDMKRLEEAEMVRPVDPLLLVEQLGRELEHSILTVLELPGEGERRREAFEGGHRAPMHLHKMHWSFFQSLSGMGLAEKRRSAGPGQLWIDMELTTAREYTAALALGLQATDPSQPTPISDSPTSLVGDPERVAGREELEVLTLADVLPAPTAFDLDELIAFKVKHRELAAMLRKELEKVAQQARRAPDDTLRAAVLASGANSLRERIDELTRKMEEHRGWAPRLGDLAVFGTAATAAAAEVAAGAPEVRGIVAPVAVAVVYEMAQRLKGARDVGRDLRSDPLAYAVFARQQWPDSTAYFAR